MKPKTFFNYKKGESFIFRDQKPFILSTGVRYLSILEVRDLSKQNQSLAVYLSNFVQCLRPADELSKTKLRC